LALTYIQLPSPSCTVTDIHYSSVSKDVMAIQIHSQPCQRKCLLTENRHRNLLLLWLCAFYDKVENISSGNVCCRM